MVSVIVLKTGSILVPHYSDVIMRATASEITSLTSVYSTVYSGANKRKHRKDNQSQSLEHPCKNILVPSVNTTQRRSSGIKTIWYSQRRQKHHWEVCNCRDIDMTHIYIYLYIYMVLNWQYCLCTYSLCNSLPQLKMIAKWQWKHLYYRAHCSVN